MEEEIRLHLEARIEELVGEGLDPERARVVAMERFGDVERTRAVCVEADRRWMMRTRRRSRIDRVAVDLRMAGRALAARPWFTVSAVATLVLGIGASTAIVSAADHILFRPLPYADADRVVTLWRSDPRTGETASRPPRATSFSGSAAPAPSRRWGSRSRPAWAWAGKARPSRFRRGP